ncbi:protein DETOXIFICATION 20-like protein [Cinnamomum micranthum f. kanehirae]|uniref:Protein DETOXIFICATION n=1 Tax=Cinnamomum micranthum f. kanehirae TaxID=337451 RepID=A0A3S3PWL7_9MAGN|nr:protein DETOXIFICATION 20-like protein [Cinnamomum micranthum f. kanehirae]
MEENGVQDRLLGSENQEEDLKRRVLAELKILWRIAFPAILTRICSFGLLVVTQSFMGHISEVDLSAFALVQTLLLRFSNGILLGMACSLETLCGQAFGAKQYHMMGIYLQRSWVVLTVTALLLVPFFVFATPLLKLVGQTDELSEKAGVIALWFIPFLFYFVFNFTLQNYLQAQLRNAIIGWLSAGSFVLHVILSWVMVDKLNWGIAGAMGSMILTGWLSVIGEFVYVFGGWCPQTWSGFSMKAFSELWAVVKLSVSSGVMICLELWYNSVLLLFAGFMKNATIAIASFSICLNITAWVLMISLGFLTAASVRVSNELGRGNAKAAKFAIKVVFSTSLAIGLVFFIVFLSMGNVISYAFTSSVAVAKVVSNLSVLLSITVLLNSIQPVFNGVAIGAGWQSIGAYVNIGCYYVIGIPLGLILAYVADLEVNGIWIGMTCGIAAQSIALLFITGRTNWDQQVVNTSARLDGWLSRETDNKTSTSQNG